MRQAERTLWKLARIGGALAMAALLLCACGNRVAEGTAAGGAGSTAGASGAASAKASAGSMRSAFPGAAALPPFALFGWVSPPNDSTTPERMAEMAELGLNVLLPAWADSGRLGDNLRRIRLAADHGMRCLVWDDRFRRVYDTGELGLATVDTIVADYSNEPGFLGYYFTDEPPQSEFKLLARIYSDLRARDPRHPAWDNLKGFQGLRDHAAWDRYMREVVETVGPSVLCNDHYDFLERSDQGQYVANVAALRALGHEYGLHFWFIVLLVQHGPYRALTPGELRWQVSLLLAYGARGVGYFTYWTPAPDPAWNWQRAVIGYDGVRGPWYGVLAAFNPGVRAAGEALAGFSWLSTQHAGSVPAGGVGFVPDDWVRSVEGRAAIGRFAGAAGERYLLVANSDSLASRTVTLWLPRARRARRLLAAGGAWSELDAALASEGVRIPVALESGGFALIRLGPDPAPAKGPALAFGPNPARGIIRFAVSRIAPGARLEITDAQGRRVWSSALGSNGAPLEWNGAREGGGSVRPGVYIARVSDAGGAATARFSWLGSR